MLVGADRPGRWSCSASRAWHLRARAQRRRCSAARPRWRSIVLVPVTLAEPGRRQPLRPGHDRLPADEDRRRRGALEHRAAGGLLAVPDRRLLAERPGPDFSDPGPAAAVGPRHRHAGTARSTGSTRCRPSTSSSTGRGTTSRRCGRVLGDARDGLRRHARCSSSPLVGAWLYRKRRLEQARWYMRSATVAIAFPFIAATAGWILTEMGRQPWIVQGLLRTADAHSPSVSAATIATSIGVFALLYAALGVVDIVLMRRYARVDPPDAAPPPEAPAPAHERSEMTLEIFWFCVDRGPLGRLLRARGVRLRRRDAAAVPGARRARPRASCWRRSGRTGTATRSGSSSRPARRSPRSRRGTRRCSPASTSSLVLILVLPDRARAVVRVARARRRPALARRLALGEHDRRASGRRSSGAWRSPTCSTASRSTATATSAGTCCDLFNAYTVAAGVAVIAAVRAARRDVPRAADGGRRCASGRARPRRRLAAPAALVVAAFLAWTVQVAVDRNDRELVPGADPGADRGAPRSLSASLTALRGRSGWAFTASTAVRARARGDAVLRRCIRT